MVDHISEEEFIFLANNNVRRVATPEGAQFYGLPVGSIITADIIKAKREEAKAAGKSAPKGGLKTSTALRKDGKIGWNENTVNTSGSSGSSKNTTVSPSSLSGPNGFKVGDSRFSAPAGAKLIRSKNNSDVAYVLTPDGVVHAFNASGEIPVPENLKPILEDKFSKLEGSDNLYTVEKFDAASTTTLASQKQGATLTSDGEVVFEKTSETSWTNPALGAELTDDDLQPAFDSGKYQLVPAETVQSYDFASMTADELDGALTSLPVGHTVYFSGTPMSKISEGMWRNDKMGNSFDQQTFVDVASSVPGSLSDKAPSAPEEPKKNSSSKKSEAAVEDPLLDPENEINDANAQKKKALENAVGSGYIQDASAGDAVYHDAIGVLTKNEDGTWTGGPDETVFSSEDVAKSAGMGHISSEPWKLPEKKEEDVAPEAESSPKAPEPEEVPENSNFEELVQQYEYDDDSALTDFAEAVSEYGEDDDDLEDNDLEDGDLEDKDLEDSDLSAEDAASAVESLEAHSGFQIAYGLKSLPDDHPLKNKDTLDKVVAEAKSKFPDMSPKKALIAHLKGDTLGEPLADWEKELLNGDMITIGSETPKDVQTGKTGGKFTPKEIQEAIDLLENFQGKTFKNYLNQNGSPLGKLAPNEIVGFNKDKTITKNNFLNLLKKKLADNQKSDATPEPVDAPEEETPDLTSLDPATLSKKQVQALPVGTVAYFGTQGGFATKESEDFWKFGTMDFSDSDIWSSFNTDAGWSFTEPEKVEEPKAPEIKTEGKVASFEDFQNLPVGQKVGYKLSSSYNEPDYYTKVDDNAWVIDAYPENPVLPDTNFVPAVENGYISYAGGETPEVSTEDNYVPEYENGHVLISDPNASQVGPQAGSNEGGLYDLDTADGDTKQFYVKKAQSESHGNNEALANALYKELGVNTPNIDYASDGNLYSEIVVGKQNMSEMLSNEEWRQKVQKDFAIDAWLSNRDVFGMTYDNILTSEDGTPWRIDNGGALMYRAMGELKSDFGNDVTELTVFRQGKKSAIFGPDVMNAETELDGAKRIADLSPQRIREMVEEYDLPSDLADTLVARRNFVLGYYNLDDPYAEKPEGFDINTIESGFVFTESAQVDALPAGAKINFDIKQTNFTPLVLTKQTDGSWLDNSGKWVGSDLSSNQNIIGPGYLSFNSLSVEPANGIAPGKYNTGKGAKAHLWVKPDGSGVYQGMKGILKPLDAEGVKKNYDAGMSNLVDTPDPSTYPDVEAPEATPEAPSVVTDSIPAMGTVETLPDGVYDGPAGSVITVTGDNVKIATPAKTAEGVDAKVGTVVPGTQFLEDAPVGTKISFKYYAGSSDDPYLYTKQENGEWVSDTPENKYAVDVKNAYWGHIASEYSYYHKNFKVYSFPKDDEKLGKKSTIKAKYLQGKLLDQKTQSSVLPPNYSGALTFYGGAASVSSLVEWRNYLSDPDNDISSKASAHGKFGLSLDVKLLQAAVGEKLGGEWSDFPNEQRIEAIVGIITDYTKNLYVPKPTKALDAFTLDAVGIPTLPEVLSKNVPSSYYTSAAEYKQYVQSVIDAFKGSVGEHMKVADKYDKYTWATALKDGDFKKAYELEVSSAKSKGKALSNPMAHPGHPANEETHKINWGAAVPGEYPAGHKIEGNWSSTNVKASAAEINNYLIAAKMQYPEYLDLEEKRAWVSAHRTGDKYSTDYWSVAAKNRKEKGQSPQSEPPVWTDDVQPAKSYDYFFDGTAYPQNWTEDYNAALEFYNDHKDNDPELVEQFNQSKKESPSHWMDKYVAGTAVSAYFQKKEEAYLEELNKPVYKVFRIISTGTHPTYIVADQFNRKKIFKPLTPGKEWRADTEAAAHELSANLGFNVPTAKIGNVYEGLPMGVNPQGILMDFAPNVGSFGDVDGASVKMSDLTAKQFGELAAEHVLDWFLDNDDTHADNMLIGTSGETVAIDKGRAFFQYGHWFGLDVDNPDSLNVNTKDSDGREVVYYQMVKAIQSGEISQEQMDAAYKAATKAAKRIQKQSDQYIEDFVRKATAQRDDWGVPSYATEWPTLIDAPQSQDELVAAVLARKNSMVSDIEEMWTKLYASTTFDKPEKPAKLIGEGIASGWDEPDLISTVQETKVWGTAPMHASAAFQEGSSLIWTQETATRKTEIAGKFKLGNLSQKKVFEFLKSKKAPNNNGYNSGPQPQLDDYPAAQVKLWKKTITAAAKDVSANATTGKYDADLWQSMTDATAKVQADLDFIPSIDYSQTWAKFPSGLTVPTATVPQYSLALNHHLKMVETVTTAKAQKVATNKEDFSNFNPPQWKQKGTEYTNPLTGEKYKELYSGNYMFTSSGTAKEVSSIPDEVKNLENGWESNLPVSEQTSTDSEKYDYSMAGEYGGTLDKGGKKKLTNNFSNEGHPGFEYRITLSTGERIYFRGDGDTTSTMLSQRGTVRFNLNPDLEAEASLANVQNYMEKWGLSFDGADEDSIETVYWRQMFSRVVNSNTEKGMAPKAVSDAKDKLAGMIQPLSQKLGVSTISLSDVPEAIGLTMNAEEEHDFWHQLALETYGADTVNAFLAEGGHLPQYQHMDLSDVEKNTGIPYFNRIDVDVQKLKDIGAFIAIGNSGKDDRHFDYIKAGGMSSTEERLRILGLFKQGASSSSDQGTGGASSVFTRIARGNSLYQGSLFGDYVVYWSPEVMKQIGTYSYEGDMYGNLTLQADHNPYDPTYSLTNYNESSNETMVPNTLSIADYMEIMVFEDESKRLKAIEEMKALGFAMLRGVPIEDRLVLRSKLKAAITKVKSAW